jgi:5-methyltetrahydrofolate--homocysteine methyltransferase
MINFSEARWQKVKSDAAQWWAGKLDRPLVQMRLWGAHPGRAEPALKRIDFKTPYDMSLPAAAIVDRWDFELSSQVYLGDSFPCVWPNFGPGVLATALGADAKPYENTTWFHPREQLDIDRISFRYDPESKWMRRVKDICRTAAGRWRGSVQISMTDLGGNLDVLSTFRPGERLLLDLYDSPAEVKRLTWEAHEAWWAAFRDLDSVMRGANPGYTAWCSIFSEQSYYMLQCDFCYMIGPAMFDEFVKPELSATCAKMADPFYHLDGPGQLPHLDSLLAIPQLKGVQWVPGAGQKEQWEWPEVYRKIRAAGKLIQIYDDAGLTQLTRIAERLGDARGIVAIANGKADDRAKAEAALSRFGVPLSAG